MRIAWVLGLWLGFNAAIVVLMSFGSLISAVRSRRARSERRQEMFADGRLIQQEAGTGETQ